MGVIFVISKSSGEGGYRPKINLKGLNELVEHFHFKMEGISVMKGMVRKGDFFTKIDLQDACLTVSIHPDDRKFLQFMWTASFFQFFAFVLDCNPVFHPKFLSHSCPRYGGRGLE